MSSPSSRAVSAALFGNEKFAEVIVALAAEEGAATAQQLSKSTGIDHSMVRSVLLRAATAGIVDALPRTGGSRSAQYYQPVASELWSTTTALAHAVLSSRARSMEPR